MANIRMTKMVIIVIFFLFSLPAACVCDSRGSKYMGVGWRRGRYYCELRVPDWGPKKIWGGTYATEEEAARACDVIVYYIHREHPYNFDDSHSYIEKACASREQVPLQLEGLRKFIRTQAQRLVDAIPKEAAEDRRRDGISERVGDGRPAPPDIGSLHHAPEPSFSQEEIDLLNEVLSDRAVRDALSPNRSQLFNGEDQLQTAPRLEDVEHWVDSLLSRSDPVESVMAEMEKDGCTGEEFDDHPRDFQRVFLLWIAKKIASVLHSHQLRDPRTWYDVLAMLILAAVGHIVKIDFPSDAHKGHNSGSPKDMLVDKNHTGGNRMALHNLKRKCTETIVADKLEPHGKAAEGIESFKMMACNLEILTLLESLEHGDLVGQTVASGLLSVISSAHEKKLLIAELAIPLLIEKLKDPTLLVRSYVATTLCNLVGASDCNLFDKDDANSPFKTPGAIAGIIDLLKFGDIITGRLSAAELLWRLSQNFENRALIGECDAIPTLMDSLLESQNGIRQYCLGTLCNLSESPKYRRNIRIHKPVVALATIIGSGCPQEIADASKIIENLGRNFDGLNHEAKNELTATLIDSVKHGDPQGAKVTAIAFLRWLCEDMSAKFESTVIPLGVVPFLIGKLRNGDESGKASAARCLWILSKYQTVSKSINEYGAFPLLYALLLEDYESDRGGPHSSRHVDDNMIEEVHIPADILYWNAISDGTLPVEQW